MRPPLFSLLAVALVTNLCPIPLLAQIPLPLPNGSFEEALKGWTVHASNPDVARVLAEAASLGSKGLRVQGISGCLTYDIVSTPLPVNPGTTYCTEFWAGGGGDHPGGTVKVEMVFLGAGNTELAPAPASVLRSPRAGVGGGSCFTRVILAAAAPEGAETLQLRIKSPGNAPSGPVDLDDFRISEYQPNSPEAQAAVAHVPPPSDTTRVRTLLTEIQRDPNRGKAPPRIVLKLDDLTPTKQGQVDPKWLKVADFGKERDIKLAFGIIANSMEADSPAFFQWVKAENAAGRIEFWNHGYDHVGDITVKEFSGQPYAYQKQHITRANQLAREKLGFPFLSFGAPFNATDASTVQALSEDQDIKVWMYGDITHPAGKTVLPRSEVTLEYPTFMPNFASLIEAYAHNRGTSCIVMQGHPARWDDPRYKQFQMIVDFLIGQQVTFVFPRELAESKQTAGF